MFGAMRVRLLTACILLAASALPAGGCRAFVPEERTQRGEVVWRDARHALQTQLRFESRISLNPLNQDALTGNYESRILIVRLNASEAELRAAREAVANSNDSRGGQNQSPTVAVDRRLLAGYAGWTLEGSLFGMRDYVLAIRGTGGELGELFERELVLFGWRDPDRLPRLNPEDEVDDATGADAVQATPLARYRPARRALIAATPSPDGRWIAVLESDASYDNPGGEVDVVFLETPRDGGSASQESADVVEAGRVVLNWADAPGIPPHAWGSDGRVLYLRLNEAGGGRRSIAVSRGPEGGLQLDEATRIPRCGERDRSLSSEGYRLLSGAGSASGDRMHLVHEEADRPECD